MTHEEAVHDDATVIDRREAILRVSALLGGLALVGSDRLLRVPRARATAVTDAAFTPGEVAFLDEIAETILPATSTPGAKAAKTGAFMARMVTDSYDDREAATFRAGMKTIEDAAQKAYGKSFMALTPAQRLELLTPIDKEQKEYSDALGEYYRKKSIEWLTQAEKTQTPTTANANAATAITADSGPHYFRMMKELALLGYFTSEVGMTKALRYIEAPGRYDPCLPYKVGEKSWASHA